VGFEVEGKELILLRQMACQPPRLRHTAVEWLAVTLGVTAKQAEALMERLAASGLVTCHRDADDGRICCASPTELGLAAAASSEHRQLRLI
jgi:DNA-binding MarR family transcriptional regulator